MNYVFLGQQAFNEPLNCWNTGSVTNMNGMFYAALRFNQDIGNWDTTKVTNFQVMLSRSTSFNQNLCNWWPNNSLDSTNDSFNSVQMFALNNCDDTTSPTANNVCQSCTGRRLVVDDDRNAHTNNINEKINNNYNSKDIVHRRGLFSKSTFPSSNKASTRNSNSNSNSNNSNKNNGDIIKRKMQESEDTFFAVTIELATDPTSDGSSSPAYGPFLGLDCTAMFGAVVVAAATLL
jgi:surface protein